MGYETGAYQRRGQVPVQAARRRFCARAGPAVGPDGDLPQREDHRRRPGLERQQLVVVRRPLASRDY